MPIVIVDSYGAKAYPAEQEDVAPSFMRVHIPPLAYKKGDKMLKDIQIAKEDFSKPWIDYSALCLLMACPRQYYWRVIRNVASSVGRAPLINGEAYHKAIAQFHIKRMEKRSFEESANSAINQLPPIMSKITEEDPKRNLSVATETIVNYLSYWSNEKYVTTDVEIGFALDLVDVVFVGKIDRRAKHPAFGKVIFETKTTSIVGNKWHLRTRPNLQITTYFSADYILTGELGYGGILDVIPLHADSKKRQDPFRLIAPRGEKDVDDWIDTVHQWYRTLKMYKDSRIFPVNTENCHPLTSWSCDYATLCPTHPHPHLEGDIELTGDYVIEEWHPYDELVKK